MPSSSPSASNIWVLLGLGVAGIILMARKLNKAVKEDLGAFVERLQLLPPPQPPTPKAPHPLTGLSFAVTDDDGILVVPTITDPPPKLGSKELFSEGYQTRVFSLLAIASMSGCCQGTLPLGSRERCPVSVSFIARHRGDLFLLSTVEAMYTSLQEQADMASKSNLSSNVISQEESAEIAKEKNVKVFLRRGTAREMLGYYEEAIEDFGYALDLEPTNKTANLAVNRLRKLFQ